MGTSSIPSQQAFNMLYNPGSMQDPKYTVQLSNMNTFSPVIAPQFNGTGYVSQTPDPTIPSYSSGFNTYNILASDSLGGSPQTVANWLTFGTPSTQSAYA
jgi:hypothetical protein